MLGLVVVASRTARESRKVLNNANTFIYSTLPLSSIVGEWTESRLSCRRTHTRLYTTSPFLSSVPPGYRGLNQLTKNGLANSPSSSLQQWQQLRYMGRKGGASAFKPRPPTRKQRKRYHKRMRDLHHEKVGKHSAPGSKAGIRRQFARDEYEYYLDKALGNIPDALPPDQLEYDFGDALLDDLMGNTSHLSSSPDPKPSNLGHAYKHHRKIIFQIMERYRTAMDAIAANVNVDHDKTTEQRLLAELPQLPTDHQISLLLRSYRDKHTSQSKSKQQQQQPMGIVKALKHLLTDMHIPTHAFGEETFTTLLTCSSSPLEARRIFKLMKDNHHTLSSYSYSILVDIYAQKGDFRGAKQVMEEMRIEGNMQPSLAAYTSLLKACFKACNFGAMPQSIKAEAGALAWDSWKEMRIVGIDPDVMAYGAMIRIMAARGLPEQAINLIEEMQHHNQNIKPTTLIYTSALRAISRSHAKTLRFEGGTSKKNKRREEITAHHGKMARTVVIMAEQAEVVQDDGFVSALMLCAATAGDSSTVKAVYLGSEVRRRMEHLRVIGGAEHLDLLQGGGGGGSRNRNQSNNRALESSSSSSSSSSLSDGSRETSLMMRGDESTAGILKKDYGHGNDTRRLSALLYANSQAMESGGLGNMWSGVQNKGYLCEHSLRLLVTRPKPNYVNKSIPGLTDTEAGLSSMVWDDDDDEEDVDKRSKQLRRKKFQGGELDEDAGTRVDELDPGMYELVKEEYYAQNNWFDKSADDHDGGDNRHDDTVDRMTSSGQDDFYFDNKEMKWKSKTAKTSEIAIENPSNKIEKGSLEEEGIDYEKFDTNPYFDENDLDDHLDNIPELMSNDFEAFYSELQAEIEESDSDISLDEEEARELFDSLKAQYAERKKDSSLDNLLMEEDSDEEVLLSSSDQSSTSEELHDDNKKINDNVLANFMDELEDGKTNFDEINNDDFETKTAEMIADLDDNYASMKENMSMSFGQEEVENKSTHLRQDNRLETVDVESKDDGVFPSILGEDTSLQALEFDETKDELASLLPGLPEKRLLKVREVFKENLGNPSMLRLVPVLRENMPEYVSNTWLKRKNMRDAYFVVQQAEADDMVDVHILNSMLQVLCKSGSLDKALEFHDEDFSKKNKSPTAYSDRIVLQMLIANNRITRALEFKDKVESHGRKLDLLSYGSLVEYYGNHGQLGSALLILKECISAHGAPPPEKSLSKIRLICRKEELEEAIGLTDLIGEDPLSWLRHGEKNLKREYSKKGRRQITLPRDRMLQI